MPVIFLRRAMINETVDGFVGNNTSTGFALQVAGDLLGRPALDEPFTHIDLQGRLTREFKSTVPMSPPLRQLLCPGRRIAAGPDLGGLAVAF